MSADPAAARRICKRSLVSGRVQGVFYRASTAAKARELGVDGYARNLPDGRVEVLACGPDLAVEELTSWLWTGSSASKVTDVQVETLQDPPVAAGSGFRHG
jgi:acylphosphatase